MSLIDRIGTILRANLNDLLSRAEDPEKIINQTLMDMRQAQYEARMEVAQTIAEGKKLERDYQANLKESGNWLGKAENALKQDRDDLAREALKRKQGSADLAEGLKGQLDAHNSMVDKLKTQLRALDAKIGEAERKRQILIARQKRAEAQQTLSGALSKTDTRKAFAAFDRMEEKIVGMEDRLNAEEELEQSLSLDDEFAALEQDSAVEDELAALKAKLSSGS
ncbi:PspA/IM30 family protein [soil metagenome]